MAAISLLALVWLLLNPPGEFGRMCFFGITTFNGIPRPISDVQVRDDGELRTIPKTHSLEMAHLRWLLETRPEVLVVSTGWDGIVKISEAVRLVKDCEIRILPTKDALRFYHTLKASGKRVAIHVHSTC